MQTTTLKDGLQIPALGLGTWQLEDAPATIRTAFDLGYRLVDTSGDYGTQLEVGEAIRSSGLPREDIFLVTKVEEDEDGYDATHDRLRELGLNYADLVVIHRPPVDTAGEDIWTGLIQAKQEGLARAIGVSNYSIEQIEDIADTTGEWPAVNQIEWSPFGHSPDMLDFCRSHGILIQAYSPLTRGVRLDDERLGELAAARGKTPAQIVLRWNVQLGANPIPKASRLRHLEENAAIFDFELSDADMAVLSDLNERYSSLSGLAYA